MKKTMFLFWGLIWTTISWSQTQTPPNPNINFEEVSDFDVYLKSGQLPLSDILNYYDSLIIESGDSIFFQRKNYERTRYTMIDRLGGDPTQLGSEENYSRVLRNLVDNNLICSQGGNWKALGPTSPLTEATKAQSMAHTSAVWVSPNDLNTILAGVQAGGIYRTTDGGQNWTNVTDALGYPILGITHIVSEPGNDNILYASTGTASGMYDPIGTGIIKSTNGGLSWQVLNSLLSFDPHMRCYDIAINPQNPNVIATCAEDDIYVSLDAGITWSALSLPNALISSSNGFWINDVEFMDNGRFFFSSDATWTHSSQLWRSDDISILNPTWTDVVPSLNAGSLPIKLNAYLFGFDVNGAQFQLNNPEWTQLPNEIELTTPSPNNTYTMETDDIAFDANCFFTFGLTMENQPNDVTITVEAYEQNNPSNRVQILSYYTNIQLQVPGTFSTPITPFQSIPFDAGGIIISVEVGPSYSANPGGTFKLKRSAGDEQYKGYSAFKLSKPISSRMALVVGGADGNQIQTTNDYGNTWNAHDIATMEDANKLEIALSPTDPNFAYYGDINAYKIDLANDAKMSISWPLITANTHDDIRSICVVPDGSGGDFAILGTDGGPTSTSDYMDTWQTLNGNGFDASDVYGLSVGQNKDDIVLIGHIDNNSRLLSQGNWQLYGGGDGGYTGINPYDYESFYSETQLGAISYNNYDQNANVLLPSFSIGTQGYSSYITFPIKTDYSNNKVYRGYARVTGNSNAGIGIYNLDNNTDQGFDIPGSQRIRTIGFSESDPDVLFASDGDVKSKDTSRDLLWKSNNGGTTWLPLTNKTVSWSGGTNTINEILDWKIVTDIQVSPYDPKKIWITLNGIETDSINDVNEQLRVLYSQDGGENWIDYSEGLPNLPCIALEYYKGSNDLIFMGNDVGVYFRDADMSEWVCYSQNLPHTIISDLDINYCTQELYASTFGRGVWKSKISMPSNKDQVFITQNTIWDTPRFLYENVVVESGVTLTINNTTIKVAKDRKITIEPGAAIIIDNATLTNDCGEMWAGIVVEGNSNLAQNATNQGRLIVQNNSLIEHARNAVRLVGIDENGGFEWNKTGGYVQATNSTFRNNKRAAEFMSYHNDFGGSIEINNLSYFNNCAFETTDDLFSNEDPYAFITMYNVTGVGINGNKFVNTANSTVSERGAGIITADARYVVKAACNVVTQPGQPCPSNQKDPNVFTNLNTGIVDWQFSLISDINVSDAIFNNCTYGLKLGGSMMHDIYNNTFNIYTGDYSFPYQKSNFGIYLHSVDGYSIEGNTFSYAGVNGNGQGRNIGVASGYNLLSSGDLYRNEFNNLETGTQSFGANTNLAIDCNTYNRNASTIADIYASEFTLNNQGINSAIDPTAPVSNVFTGSCSGSSNQWQIFAEGYNVAFQNYQPLPFDYIANDPSITNQDILCTDSDVSVSYVGNNPQATACPELSPQLIGGGNVQLYKSRYISSKLSLETSVSQIDGGDTEALIDYIQNNNAGWQIKSQLLQFSPYLSDEVLIALVDKNTPTIADWVIDDVLEMNGPLSKRVLSHVINRPSKFPDWFLVKYLSQSAPVESEILIEFLNLNPSDWAISDVFEANTPLYDAEMIALINKLPPSKDWLIRDVLKINTPLSEFVWDAFNNHTPQYPSWVYNSIISSPIVADNPDSRIGISSPMDIKQKEIDFLTRDKNSKLNALSRAFLDENLIDSASYYLINDNSLVGKCLMVPLVLRVDTLQAQNHLTTIRNQAIIMQQSGQTEKSDELNKFCDYYQFAMKINNRPGGIYSMNEGELQVLTNLSTSDQSIAENANGALQFLNQSVSYDDVIDYPMYERMELFEATENISAVDFLVYPNPFDDKVHIEMQNAEVADMNIQVNIYSIHGQLLIKKIFNDITNPMELSLNNLVRGTYIIEVRSDGGTPYTHKIIKN